MSQTPTEIVQALLKDPTNLNVVSQLVAPNATYVSLNFENEELKAIMPWAGTAKGPQAVVDTYTRVGRYWESKDFQIEDIVESEGNVAVFGRFTYRSKTLGKTVTSPFCILAKVRNGQIVSICNSWKTPLVPHPRSGQQEQAVFTVILPARK